MRPTSFIGLMGLVVVGIIFADVIMHPSGTTKAAQGIATVADPTYNALLGNTTAPAGSSVKAAGSG